MSLLSNIIIGENVIVYLEISFLLIIISRNVYLNRKTDAVRTLALLLGIIINAFIFGFAYFLRFLLDWKTQQTEIYYSIVLYWIADAFFLLCCSTFAVRSWKGTLWSSEAKKYTIVFLLFFFFCLFLVANVSVSYFPNGNSTTNGDIYGITLSIIRIIWYIPVVIIFFYLWTRARKTTMQLSETTYFLFFVVMGLLGTYVIQEFIKTLIGQGNVDLIDLELVIYDSSMIICLLFAGIVAQIFMKEILWLKNLKNLLIVTLGGIPIYSYSFIDEKGYPIGSNEDILKAGGISGVDTMLKEISGSPSGVRYIVIGDSKIMFYHSRFLIGILFTEKSSNVAYIKLQNLIHKIETSYKKEFETNLFGSGSFKNISQLINNEFFLSSTT